MSSSNQSVKANTDDLDSFEQLLKSANIIKGNETLNNFLKRPFQEIQTPLNTYLVNLRENLKPIRNEQSDRLLFYAFILMSFSSALYSIQETTTDAKVKSNTEAVYKEIDRSLIRELSPYILRFFQWDFQRRVWKHHNDEYKISYLKKVVEDLNLELTGNKEQLIKKYISLLLDFAIEKFEGAVLQMDKMPLNDEQKFQAYELLRQIKKPTNKEKLAQVIDEDVEASFIEIYKPIAQNYLEGIVLPNKRFEYLIYSFIEAQNDYKKFIESILNSVQSREFNFLNEIRMAFATKDIRRVVTVLSSLFATIPNILIKNTTEAYYHIFIHVVLKLAGCTIVSEAETNQGRIDLVIEFPNLIYIIEFKLTDSSSAIDQILTKEYFRPYLALNKTKLLLGLAFDVSRKNIKEEYSLMEL